MTPPIKSNSMGTVKNYIVTTATLGLFFVPTGNFSGRVTLNHESVIIEQPAHFSDVIDHRIQQNLQFLKFHTQIREEDSVFIQRIPKEVKVLKGRLVKVPKRVRDIGTEVEFYSQFNGTNA